MISIKSDLSSNSKISESYNSNNSSSHYEESNSYNQNIVDKPHEVLR